MYQRSDRFVICTATETLESKYTLVLGLQYYMYIVHFLYLFLY